MHFAVRVVRSTQRSGTDAQHDASGRVGLGGDVAERRDERGEALATAPLLRAADVAIEDGALTLKRLRCPRGCFLSISPTGLDGFTLPPRLTRAVQTPVLAPIPENACRLEVRFQRRAVALGSDALEAAFAREVCGGLDCQPTQLRLIEQRLGGEYLIFDFLAHRLPRIAIITIR